MKKINFILITSLLVVMLGATALATVRTATTTGNWATAGTWGGTAPVAGDSAIIPTGIIVTVAANATVGAVTVNGGLTITTSGVVLTVTGGSGAPLTYGTVGGTTGTITSSTTGGVTNTITLTSGDWIYSGAFSGSRLYIRFTSTANDQTVSGALSCRVFTVVKTNATLHLTITPTISTTTTLTSGAIDYNGAGTQTVLNVSYPGNLTLSGSGTKTLTMTANRTIAGNLTVASGANFTTAGNLTLGVTGTTSVTGTLTLGGTSAKTFTGNVTINSGGVWNETAVQAVNYAGNLQNDGTFTANTGIHTFTGTTKTISGASVIAIPSLTISGTTTNNGTLTVSTTLAGASTLTNGATGTLNFGGSSITPTLTATTAGNTVNYTGAAQTVKATTYVNLTISGSGAKTTTGVTVNGIFTMASAATASVAPTYGAATSLQYTGTATQTTGPEFLATMNIPVVINNSVSVIISGAKTINNTLTISGSGSVDLSSVTINGTLLITGLASVILPSSLTNLTVNSSSGMNLNNQTTLSGTLTFTLGNLLLGNYNLTLGSTATVVGAADGKCVVTNGNGVVSRIIAAAGSFTFPVGVSTRYNPVIITNNDVAVQTYTAAVVVGENPVTNGDAYACNRTWNITKTGTSTADVTFTWNSLDMGGSCVPMSCTAWRHNGTAWTEMGGVTSGSAPTYTTILTSVASFSPWTVGNSGLLPVQMTSFTATLEGTSALLKWATATETNNSGFQIERSIERSGVWVEVAFVNGAGTSSSPKTYSYEDKNLAPGAYIYRIKQIDNDGKYKYYTATMPKVDAGVSNTFQLGGNYPNPFNPTTTIQFSVPQDGYTSLKVYNIIGQEVATLFAGMARAGHYIPATFDASRLASGIYFARLQYSGKSLVQRMLLTK